MTRKSGREEITREPQVLDMLLSILLRDYYCHSTLGFDCIYHALPERMEFPLASRTSTMLFVVKTIPYLQPTAAIYIDWALS